MLSPFEFTVGNIGAAKPLSLLLTSNSQKMALLVGQYQGKAAAVFLLGEYQAHFLQSEGNENIDGLIVPNVNIEIDETSFIDTYRTEIPLLSVIRTDTQLVIAAKSEHSPFSPRSIVLYDNLASVGTKKAAFTKWQVVLGEGANKRILWTAN